MSNYEFQAPITVIAPVDFGGNLQQWLLDKAKTYKLTWLLAHADDGVNWGVFENDKLTVSSDHYKKYAPPLRTETLQQLRLFGTAGELYLWQVDGEWRGRFLAGSTDETLDTLSTKYLLWGDTQEDSADDGFVLLADGVEGLRHAPPLPPTPKFDPKQQNLCVQVQHYLAYDEDGQAHIAASRLVELMVVAKREEK